MSVSHRQAIPSHQLFKIVSHNSVSLCLELRMMHPRSSIIGTGYIRTFLFAHAPPSKFFLALQSFCCRVLVVLLSYDSRSTLIRIDRTKKFARAPILCPPFAFTAWILKDGPYYTYVHRKTNMSIKRGTSNESGRRLDIRLSLIHI